MLTYMGVDGKLQIYIYIYINYVSSYRKMLSTGEKGDLLFNVNFKNIFSTIHMYLMIYLVIASIAWENINRTV